eukprot:TRINITY_DN19612_c0_g1_i1.p1 TRINITY_DN19612_c0_g1~~TRINITY_DN19612_c0_g1_i1.p1  ORF type:complete len:390 (+),score=78.13 TRINITY_DN19612_c0_g1_i1:153-1322(+)
MAEENAANADSQTLVETFKEDVRIGVRLPPEEWRMHGQPSPLFKEYLELVAAAGWGDCLFDGASINVGPEDALIVVDMQNDFIPKDSVNRQGGAFGCAEGSKVADPIVKLMQRFASEGGRVVATRDYHPADHCSFLVRDGPFPSHCVQGSVGANFYKPVGDCLQRLRRGKDQVSRVEIVFKGFCSEIDSFGAVEYPDNSETFCRLCNIGSEAHVFGCPLPAWTGSFQLTCSSLEQDVNAPPDVMAVHRRVALQDYLKNQAIRRVFVCGLALDYCVLDTALNARKTGQFDEVFIILDATRAAYIKSIGLYGSGFLQDPAKIKVQLEANGVRLLPTVALLPDFVPRSPFQTSALAGLKAKLASLFSSATAAPAAPAPAAPKKKLEGHREKE